MSSSGLSDAEVRRSADSLRVDPRSGIREELAFHGPIGARTFSCTHLPARRPVGAVVVCSPLHAEFQTNYRREVLVGRALAARGVAAHRFHYCGTGNSEGTSNDATFESMRDEAASAAERLVERTGVSRAGFLGTRFGSLVAASVASLFDEAPLALWEPVLDGPRYFKDMSRAIRILDLKAGATDGLSFNAMVAQLRRTGTADIVGYSVHRSLYESSLGRTLVNCVGERRRPILFVQLGQRNNLRAEYQEVVSALREVGCSVDVRAIHAKEAWWFSNEPTRAAPISRRVVDATADWLATAIAGRSVGG